MGKRIEPREESQGFDVWEGRKWTDRFSAIESVGREDSRARASRRFFRLFATA